MKLILRHAGLLASAAFVLTAASAAVAGEPAAKKEGEVKVERKVIIHRAGGPGGHHGGPMGPRHHDPEAHAQYLRDSLQLRPDQEPALKAYLEATKPDIRKFEMKHGEGMPAEKPKMLTTPERLDRQAKMMADHQAAFQKSADATRAFYAALSPSQQKAFDVLHARGHGGPRMKVMRMGGPGRPGPGGAPGEDRIVMLGGPGELAMLDGEDFEGPGDDAVEIEVEIDE
jgi:protein CpxP